MGNPNSPGTLGKLSNRSNGGSSKKVQQADPQPLIKDPNPTFILPPDFNNYTWSGVTEDVGGKAVEAKEIDKILTDYCRDCFKTRFIIEFIKFVEQQYSLFSFSKADSKFGYAVNLYLQLCGFSLPIYGKKIEEAMALYFYRPLSGSYLPSYRSPFGNMNNIMATTNLNLPLPALANEYVTRLANSVFHNGAQTFKIDRARAQELINAANAEMDKDIDVYFVNAKARALTALPSDVKSDERFVASMHDARWNEYDETIKKEVAYYNQKFAGVAGYVPLDWRYVKAMIWTEVLAGPKGNSKEWRERPMQIGVPGDPGFPVLKAGGENTDLILDPEFQTQLKQLSKWDGQTNVRAGIAWLFRKAAGDRVSVDHNKVDNPQILIDAILKTDRGFDGIAKRLGTTTENLIVNNPGLNPRNLKIGDPLKYQRAHAEKYISGWLDWQTAIKNYNSKADSGKGDDKYTPKVERAYQIITSRDK